MRMTPLEKDQAVAKAVAMRAETGVSWASIAATFGVSTTWLTRRLTGIEVPALARAITPEMAEEAKKHRANGVRWSAVARRVGAGNVKLLEKVVRGNGKREPKRLGWFRLGHVDKIVTPEQLTEQWDQWNFGHREMRQEIRKWLLQCQAGYAVSHSATSLLRNLGLIGRRSRDLSAKGRIYLLYAFDE